MAFWTMADRVKICSIVPFIPVRNPFCKLVSTRLLHRRNLSRRVAIRLLKSFPMADVRAIGWKFSGLDGLPFLKMSLILAWHQSLGASIQSLGVVDHSIPPSSYPQGTLSPARVQYSHQDVIAEGHVDHYSVYSLR